jgi:hypothetical protein
VLNALVVVGGLAGKVAGARQGYGHAGGRVMLALVLPIALGRPIARVLALGGTFVATRRPRVRLQGVGPWASIVRVGACLSFAAHAAFALILFAYGIDAAIELVPWTLAADQAAWATAAMYGALLLGAGDHHAQARVLKVLSLGLVVLAIVCYWAGTSLAREVDAYASPVVALLAVVGALSLRQLLVDRARSFDTRQGDGVDVVGASLRSRVEEQEGASAIRRENR